MKIPVFKDLKEFDLDEAPPPLPPDRVRLRYSEIPNGIPVFSSESSRNRYWNTLNRPETWRGMYSHLYFWVNRSDLPQS